jgi:translation initiation factor IF-3
MRQKEAEHKINYLIKSSTVRLVGDNVENCVSDTRKALSIAREMGLDLVEISNNGGISICKIVDYNKFLFDKKKKEKELKKKQKEKQFDIKEIRMTPNTDDHDFNFKLNHAKNFLSHNDKVLLTVFFKGREITYKEKGEIILLKFAQELEGIGIAENLPKLEGKKMVMTIKPIKK